MFQGNGPPPGGQPPGGQPPGYGPPGYGPPGAYPPAGHPPGMYGAPIAPLGAQHGFAPPRAGLPKAKSKQRSSWAPVLIASFVLTLSLGAGAVYFFFFAVPSPAPAAQVQLAQKLPTWVPVFPNGQITASQLFPAPEADNADGTVTLLALEPLSNVLNFYKTAPKRKGFAITALTSTPDQFVIEAKSTDGSRKLIVTGEPRGSGAQVVLILSTRHTDRDKAVPGDSFPAFVPSLPGAQLLQQSTRSKGKQTHGFMQFESGQAAPKILAFYATSLEKAGFLVTKEEFVLSAVPKNDPTGGAIQVIVAPAEGKQQVSVIVPER